MERGKRVISSQGRRKGKRKEGKCTKGKERKKERGKSAISHLGEERKKGNREKVL